ncbi:MAG: steroid reductase, partial [Pseudobutyrivibrio sp.]|nr:steroid reductase [Pseudobutyrivibrio sp.]
YVCIVYIMVDGAKRMEKGHIERYGNKEEYQNYANKTPILIPLIPLYHLYKEK